MTRTLKCIGILFLGCLLFSCATWDKIEGTTPEEKKKFNTSKDQLWDANKRYEVENRRFQEQVEQLKNNATGNENKIGKLHKEITALKTENIRLKNEGKKLEDRIAASYREKPATASHTPDPVLKKPVGNLKIKVLGGGGSLNSANRMAGRLREMGYGIERIQMAPTSNFSKDTVFYKKGFENEAEDLVARIGGNAISKALTWESIFDLILVTGKR
mgnify:FL=1|jgi:regulator of replication initiation timing